MAVKGTAMKSIGLYRIILHPGADPEAFEKHVAENAVHIRSLWADTRLILNSISTRFMRDYQFVNGEPSRQRQYVWETMMDLAQVDPGFDFGARTEALQDIVRDFATVFGVDTLSIVYETS